MDVLERLERWLPPGDPGEPEAIREDIAAAIAEIKRLRALVGAVSDLPANDQTLVDRLYGGRRGDPG